MKRAVTFKFHFLLAEVPLVDGSWIFFLVFFLISAILIPLMLVMLEFIWSCDIYLQRCSTRHLQRTWRWTRLTTRTVNHGRHFSINGWLISVSKSMKYWFRLCCALFKSSTFILSSFKSLRSVMCTLSVRLT